MRSVCSAEVKLDHPAGYEGEFATWTQGRQQILVRLRRSMQIRHDQFSALQIPL
jgi:hypothetical protein